MIVGKITKKGQITIPAKFRKKLKTNTVIIKMENDKVIIEPKKELAGVFQKYSIKDKPIDEIMKLEKEAFANAIKEKHSGNRR